MPDYKVFHPDHEQIGRTFIDFSQAVNSEKFLHLFEKYGLADIDPEQWYPVQNLLDVLSEITADGSGMLELVSIGIKMVEDAILPFDDLTFEEVLQSANQGYQMNTRGTDTGEIMTEIVGPDHARFTIRTPYPDDWWYGVLYGYARRFSPPDAAFNLAYDNEVPRRDLGGDVTVIHITW